MKIKPLNGGKQACLALALALMAPAGAASAEVDALNERGAPAIRSFGRLAFGPGGVLLVGDSAAATVWAIDVGAPAAAGSGQPLTVEALDRKVAALLGTTPDEVLFHDMAVSPVSRHVYLAVSRGLQQTHARFPVANAAADASILLRVDEKGTISEVPLSDVRYAQAAIPNAPAPDQKLWEFRRRSFTITDLDYAEGRVFVAGLSNEEFSSVFRAIPWPFDGRAQSTSLEIYHAAHGKWETEAPIESFLPYSIGGRAHLLAAYTCTPLAVFPMEALKPGAHVKGTTVAEFGAGNFPSDMLLVKRGDKPFILLANTQRPVMRIDPADLEKSPAPLTTPITDNWGTAGIPAVNLPFMGVQHMDRLDDQHVLLLMRSVRDGQVRLASLPVERI
ncbi:MAG: hypothetical protein KJ067_02870 [Vicinamibacteria bacterium]|jgi:hypothetical protein|nr:hypothetical protein [Vicinamibacteria bacterium]